jgi:NitT/TauT family transport system substrate-binding protein
VRFATDWHAQAEHGGWYAALASGEFARRGLDVTIIPGGAGANVPELLAAGAADLGIGSNAFGALNRVREGVPVRAVAAVFQKDPQVLMAHPDGGVARLEDLRGDRPLLVAPDATPSLWPWLKARFGVTDAQRRTYSGNSAPFLNDRRAVQEGYATSEPYTIRQAAGWEPTTFLLADHGYSGYAAMVAAPQTWIDGKPAAVKAFVDATALGWRAYLHGDPAAADALILRDNPQMRPDVLAQARDKLRAYAIVEPPGGAPVGTMTAQRWADFAGMAKGLGLYPAGLDVTRAYTLQFLPHA